jgi:hypothetical protein
MSKRATVLCGVVIAAISTAAAATANECSQPVVLGSAKNVVVNAAVTRTRLPIASGALQSKTELVLRDIRFDAHPGTQFNVILERHDDSTKRARVGTLSFYMPVKARGTTSRTFDVSDELQQIAVSAANLDHVDVVLEATTGRGGANAKATFEPRSKLTIGAVELRVKAK